MVVASTTPMIPPGRKRCNRRGAHLVGIGAETLTERGLSPEFPLLTPQAPRREPDSLPQSVGLHEARDSELEEDDGSPSRLTTTAHPLRNEVITRAGVRRSTEAAHARRSVVPVTEGNTPQNPGNAGPPWRPAGHNQQQATAVPPTAHCCRVRHSAHRSVATM